MRKRARSRFCLSAALIMVATLPVSAKESADDIGAVYANHCARCHGEQRLGSKGPVLLPENLRRLGKERAAAVIAGGRPATQMPGFADKLGDKQIAALVEFIFRPPRKQPVWRERQIRESRRVYRSGVAPGTDENTPRYSSDPLNLFVIVESGDHHVSVMDGDSFEILSRFPSRYALHGGPKYSSDGRYVYFASRDGWISKYDMYRLEMVAEVRAGINTRNAAVSADDRYVMVGNYLPNTLVILDAVDLSLIKLIDVRDDHGAPSRISAVYTVPPRNSFVAALKDIKELWEISYADDPEPVYNGLMHDYRLSEGLAETGPFPVRRVRLDDYLDDFFFTPDYQNLIGASREAGQGQVVNLLVGRKIADVDLPGLPHLGSGISWHYGDRQVLASPNLKAAEVSVIDMNNWKIIDRIETHGPGFFIRSHENTPYVWVDVFFGPHRDEVHVIDKQTLKIIRTLRPQAGKTAAHVEFTRDGRYALLSIMEDDGAIVVYDSRSLQEVKRIPMRRPVGKYNVFNKISRSEGTSH